jgi:GntR family transcriptional regulator
MEVRRWLREGTYQPGEQLPPEPALATQLNTSRVTLREALRELQQEGLLQRRHGVGTFVSEPGRMKESLHLNFGVTHLIRQMNRDPGTKEASYHEEKASDLIREHLELEDDDDTVIVLERVRTADNQPVVYSQDYVPRSLVPNGALPVGESIYRFLRDVCGRTVVFGEAHVKPGLADKRMAKLLDVRVGELLLVLDQIDFDERSQPVLFSREWHLASAFDFVILRRDAGLES